MDEVSANVQRAMRMIQQNQLAEALEILEPICNSGNAGAEVWCWTGIAQLSTGCMDKAERSLQLAVEMAPASPVANFAFGTLLIKQQE